MLDWLFFLTSIVVVASLCVLSMRRMIRRRFVRWLLALTIALLAVAVFTYRVSRSRTFQLFDHIVVPARTGERVVALTFDDGPTEHTTEVLEVLHREHAVGTFFLIGSEIAQRPGSVRAIAAAGHEIGNHSYSHDRMIFKSERWIAREVEQTDELIRREGYRGVIHFRTPYGKRLVSTSWYLARHERLNIFFDVEPESDPRTAKSTEAIVHDVLTKTRPGSIVLLHTMYAPNEPSRRALPQIIRGLRASGYRFVTVSELLRERSRV